MNTSDQCAMEDLTKDYGLDPQSSVESAFAYTQHVNDEESSSSSGPDIADVEPSRFAGRHRRNSRQEGGHDYRADLERMTSRRNFSVDMSNNNHGGGMTGAGLRHRPRRSSGSNATQPAAASERPEEGQAVKVMDFFREVNKDAHVLKRMGSDGVHGCGGMIVSCLASCFRRIGLGNPGASVGQVMSPYGYKTDPMDATNVDGAKRNAANASDDFAVDEDMIEDDDEEVDAEEIIVQKKKVHDLGELPALDWTNVSRNLLICIVVCGALLLTTLAKGLDDCVPMGNLCLRVWLYVICVSVGAYFVIEMMAKVVAGFFKWTLLLHTNNVVWIFIKLHKEVSLLVWTMMIYILWEWFMTTKWVFNDNGAISQIMGCFLAYTAVKFVSEMCKVEMAHQYMWRPYLERARDSIWFQYVMFMMTDFAMGMPTKDAEGQALALGFTRARKVDEHLSLYTIGKAIGFVHANALKHPLGPGRPGTDKEGMINSKTGARLFGALLFDALMIKFNDTADHTALPPVDPEKRLSPRLAGNVVAPHSNAKEKDLKARLMASPDESALPRPSYPRQPSLPALRPMLSNHFSHDQKSPGHERLSAVLEDGEQVGEDGVDETDNAQDDDRHGTDSTSTEEEEKWAPSSFTPKDPSEAARKSAATGAEQRRLKEEQTQQQQQTQRKQGNAGKHHRRGSTAQGGHVSKGITLAHLRQMTGKALALQIMELFDVPPEGVVSRKMFMDRMVAVFVQRRSLQLTLGDYEAILKKVGYLLGVISGVIVFFVALRIFGYNIGSLVLTWLSLAVAFSFLFGSSASAFFESIIFIFVTKAYDVGDPVFFVDDTGIEDWYIVTRINMLTTVFRRWDGQATLLANNIMAKKAIRNQWRSGPLVHHTMIAVSIETPMEKLNQMKIGISHGMRRGNHHHRHGEGGLMPDTVDYQVKGLTDGNKLAVFILCRQRENGANMGRRFGNASLFIQLISRECNKLDITYTMPVQPVGLGGKGLEALRAREDFLDGGRPARG